jgi:hypothetical protein
MKRPLFSPNRHRSDPVRTPDSRAGFRKALIFLFVVSRLPVPASDTPSAPAGDASQEELKQNLQTARWMADYDRVAWGTTDLLVKEPKQTLGKVSPVWFCLQKDGQWYAVYGGLVSNSYEIAFCYRQSSKDGFEKVKPPEFPDKDRFARAIDLTLPEIQDTTRRTTVRFNDYIRTEPRGIAVYYLPALQTDGKLAYGIQHTFVVDPTGAKVVSHEVHGHILVGAIPYKERTVTFEMTDCTVPTPQAIFAMMSYREAFADILTHCRDGYFGMAMRDGQLVCVPTSAPPPPPPSMIPGLGQAIAAPPPPAPK